MKVVCVRELIDEMCDAVFPRVLAQNIDVIVDVPGALVLAAPVEPVRRVVLTLIHHALDAMPGGGELVITAVATAEDLEIEVADSGSELAENQRNPALGAKLTNHRNLPHSGLGSARHWAASVGGAVRAQNCPEGGAAFTFTVPRKKIRSAA